MSGKGSSPRSCFSKTFKENYDSIFWGKERDLTALPTNLSELDKMTINLSDDLYYAQAENYEKIQEEYKKICENLPASTEESRKIAGEFLKKRYGYVSQPK